MDLSGLVMTGASDSIPARVLDVETTIRSPIVKHKAKGKQSVSMSPDPFYPDNKTLCYGVETDEGVAVGTELSGWKSEDVSYFIIGHNVKFDLHYLRNENPAEYHKVQGAYDTQYMYHLLTGAKFAKLDTVAEWCGVASKLDILSKYLNDGKTTEDIPTDELLEYQRQDILVTRACFDVMLTRMSDKMLKLNNIMCRTTMMLAEMEFNGLHIDKRRLYESYKAVSLRRKELETELLEAIKNLVPEGREQDVLLDNAQTSRTINCLAFGKPYPMSFPELVGKYKNGKDKYLKKETLFVLPVEPKLVAYVDTLSENRKGEYSTDEKHIDGLLSFMECSGMNDHLLVPYVSKLVELRKINKVANTYYRTFGETLERNETSVLHHTLNQSATSTGRLSSSNPNGQNIPSDVDSVFTNRFDSSYGRLAPDFKQLEVCGAAQVCKDPQLIHDLNNDVDLHAEVSKQAGVDASQRRRVKGVVFGTVYGGFPQTLARESGFPEEVVKDIQAAFFDRYPKLKEYFDSYAAEFKGNGKATICGSSYIGGTKVWVHQMESMTGRVYRYTQKLSKRGMPYTSWTQTCNYPIQGLSTGDIVPMYLALVWAYKTLFDRKDTFSGVLFTNTVHDSIYMEPDFPADSARADELHKFMELLLDKPLTNLFKNLTGEDLVVKLKLDKDIK